ncbi:uncharacterized protein LOC131672679 isoform X5 [Phymastichus coffea]|uniref:uncharacterized protein LOC131672679 isoform X5 n=1 Tax=Phymastichus coffea TaxID=108790 RepID=UPI00273AE570|nr:uncharacterized protein LOC131672679 isoform X5 [Phymastichus coffea]
MSRHRTVRSKNFSDEYDGLEDCYGHSVEDDYCISPSAEQFMYDRTKQANIASFMTEPDIVEDIEEVEDMPSSYKVPHLSDIDAAKLMSCVETIKNVIGDTYPESELNRKIIEFKFSTEAVLESILNDESSKNITEKQPLEKTFDIQPGSKFKHFFRNNASASIPSNITTNSDLKCNSEKGCDKSSEEFPSLSDMITVNIKLPENKLRPLNSLDGLTAYHSKIAEKKSNKSTFSIPKINFNSFKQSTNSCNDSLSFSCLADLTAHHLKISNDNKSSGFVIPKIGPKDLKSDESDTPSFNSLAELSNHHLKISNNKKDSNRNFVLPSDFVTPKIGSKNNDSNQSSSLPFGSLAELTAHHLKSSNKDTNFEAQLFGFVIPKEDSSLSNIKMHIKKEKNIDSNIKLTIPDLIIKKEKDLEDNPNLSKSFLEDISNLRIEEFDPNKFIESESINFSIHKIAIKSEKPDSAKSKALELSLEAVKRECNQYRVKARNQRKSASPFGKVLCKSFSRKVPYPKEIVRDSTVNSRRTILPFDFSSPSPDSIVLARLRRGVVV